MDLSNLPIPTNNPDPYGIQTEPNRTTLYRYCPGFACGEAARITGMKCWWTGKVRNDLNGGWVEVTRVVPSGQPEERYWIRPWHLAKVR